MGDHFVLLVDRLLTESTLEAAIQSRKQGQNGHASASEVETENELSLQKRDFGDGLGKMVECRICHDEDDDSNMETPCSCCGSLKYAHRKCIQRWCNEKGDTVCEICQQQFRPGYTAPPQLFHYGGNPMNFRGNWGISRQDLHDPRFMAMVATDRDFLDVDYDDYSPPSARSMICCRAIAVIFMVLLVLRHALPIIISGDENYSFTLFIVRLFRHMDSLQLQLIKLFSCGGLLSPQALLHIGHTYRQGSSAVVVVEDSGNPSPGLYNGASTISNSTSTAATGAS